MFTAIAVGALLGLASGMYQSYQQKKQTEEIAKQQAAAAAHQELIAAGRPQAETKQNAITFDDSTAKKSAWQNAIASRANAASPARGNSKFGDA